MPTSVGNASAPAPSARQKRACATPEGIAAFAAAAAAASERPRSRAAAGREAAAPGGVAAGGVAKKRVAKAFKRPAPPVYCAGPDAKFSDLEKTLLITAIAQNRCKKTERNKQGIAWEDINRRSARGDYGPLMFRVKPYSKVLAKLCERMQEKGDFSLSELDEELDE